MKLITICNYPDEDRYNILAAWWLERALHHSNLNIEIWYESNMNNPYLKNMDSKRVQLVEKNHINIKGILDNHKIEEKGLHNIGFKLFNLCMENEPFIFLDIDAIIFSDIKPLLDAAADKPVIMIDHQSIIGHTAHLPRPYGHNFLNSGVQIVSDPSFLNYEKIIELQNKSKRYIVPGYDQALLFNYFVSIMYDYTHPLIGYTWNNSAGANTPLNMVNINHYWMEHKPWTIGCPMWNEYCISIGMSHKMRLWQGK